MCAACSWIAWPQPTWTNCSGLAAGLKLYRTCTAWASPTSRYAWVLQIRDKLRVVQHRSVRGCPVARYAWGSATAGRDGGRLTITLSLLPSILSRFPNPKRQFSQDMLLERLADEEAGCGRKYWARVAAEDLVGRQAADQMAALVDSHEGRHLDEGAMLVVSGARW